MPKRKIEQITKHEKNSFDRLWPVIKLIRSKIIAPVDIMGCDSLAEKDGPAGIFEFQILIAALLSSQTRDERTAEAVGRLKERGGKFVGPDWVSTQSQEEIADCLKPVGFYNQKAKNLKSISETILRDFKGLVPNSYDTLITFPGIGPKMASLIMSCAFNKNDSVCVDTHVHKISTALGWGCGKCTKCADVEHTRIALLEWLPENLRGDYSLQLVGLGQLLQTRKKDLVALAESLEGPTKDDAVYLLKKLGLSFCSFCVLYNCVTQSACTAYTKQRK